MKLILAPVVCLVTFASNGTGQQSGAPANPKPATTEMCPIHNAHSRMHERGEKGMGFSQSATTHHFLLNIDGGVIQVEANDSADSAGRDQIRMHLAHIAHAFEDGHFDIPMFVHDTVPPGVPEMKRLHKKIRYTFEESTDGGRVVVASTDKQAVAAIHDFLRFQIEEHGTHDSKNIR